MEQYGRMRLTGLLISLTGLLLLGSPLALRSGDAQTAGGTATFTYSPAQPDIDTLVTLDASASSSPNGAITTYEWDFNGDGQFELSTSKASVTHLFDQSGTMAVTLRVTDAGRNSFSTTQTIQVAGAPVLVRRAVSAPVAPNRVAAGSSFQVTVTIQTIETVNGLGLEEDPPQGWRVSLVDGAGAVYKSANTQFLWLETLNPSTMRQVIYDVTVPAGTTPGTYNLSGRVSSFAPRFKIEVVGDTQVQVF